MGGVPSPSSYPLALARARALIRRSDIPTGCAATTSLRGASRRKRCARRARMAKVGTPAT